MRGLVTGAVDVQILNRLLEHRAEAKQDLQLLNAQKMGEHEAEIEKIKTVFLAILWDTSAEQKQSPLSVDDVTAMVAGQIGQLAPMDKETADLFQQLMKKMIEQAGK